MARRYSLVLIFSCLFGCGLETVEYYISDSCMKNLIEVSAIREGAASWNSASCAEITKYKGVLEDKNFGLDDLTDNNFAVYCVDDNENEDANKLLDSEGASMAAKSLGDIVLRRSKIKGWATAYYCQEIGDKNFAHCSKSLPGSYYYAIFKAIIAHEFGHQMLRAEANGTGKYSLMQQDRLSSLGALEPTEFDIYGSPGSGGVCDLFDCPPREQCPTRPAK